MDIHHLKVFSTVYKLRSFSKASLELNLTQPTVSSHIKALEGELSITLFDRIGRKIIPTKRAEKLFSYAMDIIEKTEGIRDFINDTQDELSGELTIGASTIPATYIIPQRIFEFRGQYPSVSFGIITGDSKDVAEKVASHDVLLGIVGARLKNPYIEHIPFMEDELVLVTASGISKSTAIEAHELKTMPLIIREEGSGTRKTSEVFLNQKGINLADLNIKGVFGSTESVKEAVKAGFGAAILSKTAVSEYLDNGSLKEIKIKDLSMKRNFYLIYHKKRTLPHLYKTFKDFIVGS